MPINFISASLSSLFAGVAAISVTLVIEKFGGVVGGTLGTTPTTIVPGSIGFLYSVKDFQQFENSMFTVAAGMLLNTGFLYMWKEVPKYLPKQFSSKSRLSMMLSISLALWCLAALGFLFSTRWLSKHAGVSVVWIGSGAFLTQFIFGSLAVCLKPLPSPKGKNKVGWPTIISRGILAAFAIFVANLLSSLSGIAAGLATAFPAIYLTTMVSVWISQGEAVTTGAAGPMMLGGLSVPSYAITLTFLQPRVGTLLGVILSYLIAVVFVSIPVMLLLRKRQAQSTKDYQKLQGDFTEKGDEVHLELTETEVDNEDTINSEEKEEEIST